MEKKGKRQADKKETLLQCLEFVYKGIWDKVRWSLLLARQQPAAIATRLLPPYHDRRLFAHNDGEFPKRTFPRRLGTSPRLALNMDKMQLCGSSKSNGKRRTDK